MVYLRTVIDIMIRGEIQMTDEVYRYFAEQYKKAPFVMAGKLRRAGCATA